MVCLNFPFNFRSLLFLFLFAILVAGQACRNSCERVEEGELNGIEKKILKIFLPSSSKNAVQSIRDFFHSAPAVVVQHLRNHKVDAQNLMRLVLPSERSTTTTEPTPTGEHDESLTEYLPPDVDEELRRFDKNDAFTPTMKKHNYLANKLIDILMRAPNIDVLVAIGTHLYRDNVNRGLLIHSLAVALMHRPDSRDYRIGRLFQMLTDDYITGRSRDAILNEGRGQGQPGTIDIWRNYTTASHREPEHRLAYFREDLGINLHHWHWHVVYPYQGSDEIVIKDRRGELFYFLHQQIMSRYDTERLSNKLGLVKRLHNFKEPIVEAYFPKLDTNLASRSWPSRPKGMVLRDIDRLDVNEKFDIEDLNRWVNRLYDAIYMRSVIYANGSLGLLDERTGIDVLGNAVEASPNLSPNIDYYGQLHNDGHTAISFIHDPDGSHMENFGVMGTPATAMRDPVFYRWHAFMNDIFLNHKNILTPYSVNELSYPGIVVSDVFVFENKAPRGNKNHLNTFWDWSIIRLLIGVDFEATPTIRDRVSARITHLNHNDFSYRFTIINKSRRSKLGVVRIFIAPRYDERGEIFLIDEQRKLMIEMDAFKIRIPPGRTSFVRSSTDSTLTIPSSSSLFHFVETEPGPEDAYAGCGWPQHMLLPRGTKDGFPMDLFLMVSNDPDSAIPMADGSPKPAFIMCGIRGRNYPDTRPMGYPFDRRIVNGTNNFRLPNMATTTIKIQFTDAYLGKSRMGK